LIVLAVMVYLVGLMVVLVIGLFVDPPAILIRE
jgi:hypothetical protein